MNKCINSSLSSLTKIDICVQIFSVYPILESFVFSFEIVRLCTKQVSACFNYQNILRNLRKRLCFKV